MANSKIQLADGKVLLDLTGDTVTAENLLEGIIAHGANGEEIIGQLAAGGGTIGAASSKDVNFYDYDGTLLYAYTLDEAHALTALPKAPAHEGLVFDGWNWALEKVQSLTRPMNIGAMYSTDDGSTRIYIHLNDGRTSPMLGICVNGTVTVDWGGWDESGCINREQHEYGCIYAYTQLCCTWALCNQTYSRWQCKPVWH